MRDCSSLSISKIKRAAALAAAFSLASLAGCAGGNGAIPHPTAKNVELAGRNGQVTTLSTLKVGRNLYIGRCGACHSLKDPALFTPAEWPELVTRMADNAKINPDQGRAITQYLVSVSAAVHDSGSVAPKASGPAAPAADSAADPK